MAERLSSKLLDKMIIAPGSFYLSTYQNLWRNASNALSEYLSIRTSGEKLADRTRIRKLTRSKKDLQVFLPMLVYCAMPFMSYTLPWVVKQFPLMIPSVFTKQSSAAINYKIQIVSENRKVIAAKIIENFDKMIRKEQESNPDDKELQHYLGQWNVLLKQHQNTPENLNFMNIIQLYGYFRYYRGNLALAPAEDVILWSRLIGFGLPVLLKSRLFKWADYLFIDDKLLKESNAIGFMDKYDVMETLEERGFFYEERILYTSGFIETYTDLAESKIRISQHAQCTKILLDTVRRKGLMENPTLNPKDVYTYGDFDYTSTVGILILARAMNITNAQ